MSPPSPSRARLLIVHEALDELARLTEILEARAIEVLAARAAAHALELTRQLAVDAVVLDLAQLAGGETLTVARSLSELEGAPPLIFLATHEQAEALVEALAPGGFEYVSKPVRQVELLARVSSQLKLGRLMRELPHHRRALSECEQQLAEQTRRLAQGEQERAHARAELSLCRSEPPELVTTLKLSEVEEQLIAHALAQTNGNVTQAAKLLGVHRSWLYRRKSP